MAAETAGVRELKARLSAYLARVKAGAMVVITERGKPIGRIVPIEPSLEHLLDAVVRTGMGAWNGKRMPRYRPLSRVQGKRTVADLLLADRE